MKKSTKTLLGILISAYLTYAIPAAVQDMKSILGGLVEGEASVILDGTELPVEAAILDEMSYLPISAE